MCVLQVDAWLYQKIYVYIVEYVSKCVCEASVRVGYWFYVYCLCVSSFDYIDEFVLKGFNYSWLF